MGTSQKEDLKTMLMKASSHVRVGLGDSTLYAMVMASKIEECRIGNGYFSVTLEPSLFTQDQGLSDQNFLAIALQLRDTIEGHYHCGGYSLDLGKERNPHGSINRGIEVISIGRNERGLVMEFIELVRAGKQTVKNR